MAFPSAGAGYALAERNAAPPKIVTGKQLYRKYCGQCHGLTSALAAGFGSNNGLGTDGGPNLDNLKVSFNLSVLSITLPFIGHEVIVHKMSWTQVQEVSKFVAEATKHHTIVAQAVDG